MSLTRSNAASIKITDGEEVEILEELTGEMYRRYELRINQGKKINKKKYQKTIRKLAGQLTAISRITFIRLDELTNIKTDEDRPLTHQHYLNVFQNLHSIIIRDILSAKHIEERAHIMERWATVMDYQLKQNDFFSVMVINAVLHHHLINRLQITKRALSPEVKSIISTAFDLQLGHPSKGTARYTKLNEEGSMFIPYFGAYKGAMTGLHEAHHHEKIKELEEQILSQIRKNIDYIVEKDAKLKKRRFKNSKRHLYKLENLYQSLTKENLHDEEDIKLNRQSMAIKEEELDDAIRHQYIKFDLYAKKYRADKTPIGLLRREKAGEVLEILKTIPLVSDLKRSTTSKDIETLIAQYIHPGILQIGDILKNNQQLNRHKSRHKIKLFFNQFEPFQFDITIIKMLEEAKKVLELIESFAGQLKASCTEAEAELAESEKLKRSVESDTTVTLENKGRQKEEMPKEAIRQPSMTTSIETANECKNVKALIRFFSTLSTQTQADKPGLINSRSTSTSSILNKKPLSPTLIRLANRTG